MRKAVEGEIVYDYFAREPKKVTIKKTTLPYPMLEKVPVIEWVPATLEAIQAHGWKWGEQIPCRYKIQDGKYAAAWQEGVLLHVYPGSDRFFLVHPVINTITLANTKEATHCEIKVEVYPPDPSPDIKEAKVESLKKPHKSEY